MNKKIDTKLAFGILLGVIVLFLLLILSCQFIPFPFPFTGRLPQPPVSPSVSELTVEKFSSEEDFKAYLLEAELGYSGFVSLGAARATALPEGMGAPSFLETDGKGGGEPERVSETTVQVPGIDEPDIVKTDGKEIYFSLEGGYYWRGLWVEEMIMPPQMTSETKIIKAFPPTDLALENKINKSGNLLLSDNVLVIFSGDSIFGYDVSNPKSPQEKWKVDLAERNYLVGARLYKDKIYLTTRTAIDTYHPCPIRPLSVGGVPLEIKCIDIYHPTPNIPVDVTYTAMVLDSASGKVENTVSFVGSSYSSIVYMSENALYLTYSYYGRIMKFLADFLQEKCQDLLPDFIIEKVNKLESYDISDTAKMMEFSVIFEQYYNSLSRDDQLKIENEFTNRMSDYYKEHRRELEKTGIVKIGLEGFKVEATGDVPGYPLNQFSVDEYNNYLRIATTIGQNSFWLSGWGGRGISSGQSANDVYILDKDLKITGQVLDLGLTERIYSARFVEDKGYLVTFRQVDPFYVLDLSNPQKPELKGELKIPGYSSYLHPITKDKILGVGKEGSNVKISLFDVKKPAEPSEAAKYNLDEYWSDILDTHHAFLLDSKHQIFFLPGSRGGYVFSYQNDTLKMVKAVSGISAKRAIYINDYLYIIGEDKIIVLNELNWEKVKELDLQDAGVSE